MTVNNSFFKDVSAKLDFTFDWASKTNGSVDPTMQDWLAIGEKIASFVLTADSGITVVDSFLSDSDTSVTVWLSGGTENITYSVNCEITTDAVIPRIDQRTIFIKVIER
jgi:hypothetical protein